MRAEIFVIAGIILLNGCIFLPFNGKFGAWEQLNGMDGGDMHFVYSTKNNVLFLSHGFGGVWRSEDGGENWEMIKQNDFVDICFYDIEEIGNLLYAGSNKGLWYSEDEGKSWSKINTGYEEIDNGKYHVVSLAKYNNGLLFTVVLDKLYRGNKPGDGKLFYLKDGKIEEIDVPVNEEITVSAKEPYVFISSPFSGLYFSDNSKKWVKILNANTTKVFIDDNYNLYVGTIEDWWYIGKKNNVNWSWTQVKIPGKTSDTIFHFIVPDPANEKRIWFGTGRVATFYSYSKGGFGNAYVGIGYWDGNLTSWNITLHNFATSIAFYGNETVDTKYGKATKYAFITVGGQAVQKTDDGGLTWHNSYNGVFGDTINAINPVNSGILAGCIVITAVSGIEIALDNGNSWMEGIDFTIGKINGKLPGYSWCAVSPYKKINGKYDLVISTGYPSPFGGDGVFAINLSGLKEGKRDCIVKLIDGPHYEMVIDGNILYAGNMDDGIDVLNLTTFEHSKIRINGFGIPFVRMFDGKLFLETYENEYMGDGWRWSGSRGKVYMYDGEFHLICDKYVINFFVKNNEFIGLTKDSIIYKPNILSDSVVELDLPHKKYTDMAIDWEDGLVFFSTDGEGVFYTTVREIKNMCKETTENRDLQLKEINNGLLTLKIRNIVYNNGYLFAGTRGHSVWRLKINRDDGINYFDINIKSKILHDLLSYIFSIILKLFKIIRLFLI